MNKLKIGNVTLENNLVLAPMAGVTDLPFRLLCRRQGAGLLRMEMVSAKAIYYKNKNTELLMENSSGGTSGFTAVVRIRSGYSGSYGSADRGASL